MKKRVLRILLCIVLLCGLLSPAALGQVTAKATEPPTMPGARSETNNESGDVFLGGNYIEVGISKHGSFGTKYAPSTSGWHAADDDGRIGFLSDGDGWNVGEEPVTGDFFLPGEPEERWILAYKLDDETYTYCIADRMYDSSYSSYDFSEWKQEPITTDESDLANGKLKAVVRGTTPEGVSIQITYSFGVDDLYYSTSVEITNKGSAAVEELRFVRSFDPDQDADKYGIYETYNKVICNPDPTQPGSTTNYALVVARGKETLSGFFFLAFDNRARASYGVSSSLSLSSAYLPGLWDEAPVTGLTCATEAAIAMTADDTNGYTLGDKAIALTFNIGTLDKNASTSLACSSSLDPDVQSALNHITSSGVDNTNAGSFAGATASGLDEIAGELAAKEENADKDIDVKLTVTEKDKESAAGSNAIIAAAGEAKTLEFLDLALTAQVGSTEAPQDIGAENEKLLTVVLPFASSGKENISVYRFHDADRDGEVDDLEISALPKGSANAVDGEYFVTGDTAITLYVKRFSTYAIGYTLAAAPEPPIYYHYCTSKCPVCGGCKNAACTEASCQKKCNENADVFSDAAAGAWYAQGVKYCYHRDLVTGMGDGLFVPEASSTRAMVFTLLWRLEGKPAADYTMNYSDVPAGAWYAEAIRWASSVGLAEGYGDGTVGAMDNVTREQMAVLLYRYAAYKGQDVRSSAAGLDSFTDAAQVHSWAADGMNWAVSKGLIQGDGSQLRPGSDIRRGEMATLLMNFMEK